MTTQHKHTALPWKQGIIKTDVVIRYETDNGSYEADIARCNTTLPNPKETDQANAAFIVRACNNHYQLMKVLKKADEYFKHLNTDSANNDGINNMRGMIRKILAQAKGEE